MPLPTELGNKAPGQLIRSQHWNALVAGVDHVEESLNGRVDALEASVASRFQAMEASVAARFVQAEESVVRRFAEVNERVSSVEERVARVAHRLGEEVNGLRAEIRETVAAVDARVTGLERGLKELAARVEPLLRSYGVTLQTTRTEFALGEVVELTAQVRSMADPGSPGFGQGERPWVDFVSTWGQFRAAPGFVSRGGVGDRTISVQTDARGVARVLLQSEVVDDISEDAAAEVSSALSTRVGASGRSISDILLRANTPEDEEVRVAYGALTAKYDRTDAGSVRSYVDSFYVKNGVRIAGKVTPAATSLRRQRWRDYRATVMAFAKEDSDPLTAEAAHGVASIQVSFRDWITPWIIVDYFDRVKDMVPAVRERLGPKVTRDYKESMELMRDEVREIVRDRGVLGKVRDYEAINTALDVLAPAGAPDFLNTLSRSVQAAVGLQQSLEQSQASAMGSRSQEVAFQTFTNTSAVAESKLAGMTGTITALQQQVTQVKSSVDRKVADLTNTVTAVDARSSSILSQGTQLRAEVDGMKGKVAGLVQINPEEISSKLSLVSGLKTRMESLEMVVKR